MKQNEKIKFIAGNGILLAIEIVFQVIGNFVAIGPVSINLSLIPIVVGALIYGPISGALLGFVNGIVVLCSPTTSMFYNSSIIGTILICLIKATAAGVAVGFLFKAFKKHQNIGAITCSILAPIINTGLFAGGSLIFFGDLLKTGAQGGDPFGYLALVLIGWNFIFELGISIVFGPIVARVIFEYRKRHQNVITN